MTISLSKKRILWFLIPLGIFLIFFLSLYLTNPFKGDDGLKKIVKYCNETANKDKCVLLLSGEFYKEEENKRCFFVRIPVINNNNTNDQVTFCVPNTLLKWKNPYFDYNSLVPVDFIFNRNLAQVLFKKNNQVSFEMKVIEDSEINDIVKNIKFAPGEKIVGIKTKKRAEQDVKGYYLSMLYLEPIEQKTLTIYQARVKSFDVDKNNNLNIVFDAILNGIPKEISINIDSFYLVENPMENDLITINYSNISEYISNEESCTMYFSSISNRLLEEQNLEQYIEEILDYNTGNKDLLLKLLLCENEVTNN